MNEQQIHAEIISRQLSIMELVHHRTLEKFTGGPSVERTRLFFLLLPLLNGKKWSPETETAAKTVSIVHAALHAHEQVRENGEATKEQQLTVLAGDFYSGIYYQLLANLSNIQLIQQLSSGIVGISEDKASFYDETIRRTDAIDASVRNIESALIRKFYNFYGYGKFGLLAELALTIIRYDEELVALRTGGQTRVLSALTRAVGSRLKTEQWLQERLSLLFEQVAQLTVQQPLGYELENFLFQQILPQPYKAEQLTREG